MILVLVLLQLIVILMVVAGSRMLMNLTCERKFTERELIKRKGGVFSANTHTAPRLFAWGLLAFVLHLSIYSGAGIRKERKKK